MIRRNEGVAHTGSGNINVQGVVGSRATYNAGSQPQGHRPGEPDGGASRQRSADVGVITVLSTETRAVVEMLRQGADYRKREFDDGLRFYQATMGAGDALMRVVVTQAVAPGQRPALLAFERLRDHYAPAIIVLCGIAGGINPALDVGDVAIAREVIYYDLRKETPDGVQRRGQAQSVPAVVHRALNDMFTEYGEPMTIDTDQLGGERKFVAVAGPIGTGEAVVADHASTIRDYLRQFHAKTLAVETELGGVAQAFHEQPSGDSAVRGWLAVRGISDTADPTKGDAYHELASRNAAAVLRRVLPYLKRA